MSATTVIDVRSEAGLREGLRLAAQVLRSGGLVAFPTETVYGLGADALDAEAVRRIFEAKGRPANNPVIVHVADADGARQVAADWPESAARLAERFWPGPLSLVLPRRPAVPDAVTAGGPTVAVRVPAHPVAPPAPTAPTACRRPWPSTSCTTCAAGSSWSSTAGRRRAGWNRRSWT